MTISIIIPAYEAESFISRAIDSCLNQSFKGFELIVVNDGSKDNSLQIIREYAHIDKRIKVANIPNSGVVKAREYGVSVAKGEFLLFMDADDLLPEGVLQILVNAIKPDVDMVIGDIIQIEVDGSSSIIKYGNHGSCTGKEHFDWIVRHRIGFLWGKLIRKSLLEKIKVMPYGIKFCEDYLQMIQLSYFSRKVVHVGNITYNYIQQDESACNKALSVSQYAQRFADLCMQINAIISQCGFDSDCVLKLKVLYLYYCRLYLCSNGNWRNNKQLKSYFLDFLNQGPVKQYFISVDKRRYYMTQIVSRLYPLISIIYRRQLKKYGSIY